MNAIGNGILIGIMLSLMVGPALFMLIQTSLSRGFRNGLNFAFGILLSDALVLLLIWKGVSSILGEDPRQNIWFGICGGIVLILFGSYTFMKPVKNGNKNESSDILIEKPIDIADPEKGLPIVSKEIVKEFFPETSVPKWYIYIIKGVVSNIVNPGVWFIWISAMVTVSSTYQGNRNDVLAFFTATLSTAFGIDTLKAYAAGKLKNFLKPSIIHKMNQIIGIVLVLFGIYLIINSFYDLNSLIEGIKTRL
jgi:threonine/homoserine/homoserine lactone efflux protein